MTGVIFTWGRMNPPHKGHFEIIDRAIINAAWWWYDFRIYLSHSEYDRTNPMGYRDKVNLFKKAYPFVQDTEARNIIEVMQELEQDYNKVIMVVGSDRVEPFQRLLNKYNGVEYQFDDIKVVSGGERDETEIGSCSSTKMREYARNNDFDSFQRDFPSSLNTDCRPVFNQLREFYDGIGD